MYLHYLLLRDKSEMISRVLYTQINKPVKGYWFLVVKEDLESLGLDHLTLEDIASKTKYSMKKTVKENGVPISHGQETRFVKVKRP